MKKALELAKVTFIGGVRDKVFITLIIISFLCFMIFIPAASSMSMRQVREVAVSLSLSVISIVSLVLTVFLGVNLVYRDIEKRTAHSIIALPVSRESYIVGKYLGLLGIVGTGLFILSVCAAAGVLVASGIGRASLPMLWENYLAALFFEFIVLSITAAVSVFFSTFSTNVFIPLFATLGVYVIGSASQAVMDYLKSPNGGDLPAVTHYLCQAAYYVFPNLAAFDFKFHAIYSMAMEPGVMAFVAAYGLLYVSGVIGLSMIAFRKREL